MTSIVDSVPSEFDPKAVENTLAFFAGYSGTKCTEIRIIGKNNKPNKIGFYDQYQEAVERIKQFDGNAAIYFSLNRINADLKRRACNSLESVSGTKDNDVERLCWLVVDIDPCRPSDTPSTDDELGHAEDCQNRIIKEVFQPAGAEIVKAMSGNGTHTLVPIDYPNEEESTTLIKQVLESLDAKYSNQHVKVDTQFNKQVLKLYGTLAVKGSHTPEAPYRRAKIELPDTSPKPFDLRQLKDLLPLVQPKPKSQATKPVNGNYQLDMEAYLSANGLEVSKMNFQAEMHGESGTRWTLKGCPFNPDHAEAAVSQSQSGKLGFHCFHDSCQGNDWQAFKAKVGDPKPFSNYREIPIKQKAVTDEADPTNQSTAESPYAPIKLKDLLGMDLGEVHWIIPDILPEGLTVLAGRPKAGKSILALNIALSVANGGYVFMSPDHKCQKGDVLYCALEDSNRRFRSRASRLLETHDSDIGDNFEMLTNLPKLDEGGLDVIKDWYHQHPLARLLVVDVFARIKPRGTKRNSGTLYDDEYLILEELQKFAIQQQLGVLIVHHTRKSTNPDNIFDEISGSTAMQGAPDTLMIFKREAEQGKLFVQGRDVDEQTLAFEGDESTGLWILLGKAKDIEMSNQRKEIIEVFNTYDDELLSPKKVADILGKSVSSVNKMLHVLSKKQDAPIKKVEYGKYQLATFGGKTGKSGKTYNYMPSDPDNSYHSYRC